MIHRCIEGERVGVDGSKIVDVDRRPDRCPGGTPAPPEARRREPPSFCWKYALEAIINGYYYISLIMIIVYCSCYNCVIRKS